MLTKQNYYSYTEQLLLGTLHFTRVLYTFFKNYYYLIIKLLFWKQKRTIGSYTNKKVLWVVTARVFFQRFYSLMKLFFLNSLEQRDTDSVIATIPLWYSLFGVGYVSFRVWNGCVYNLWNVTQESYSVRVQVLGNHSAQGMFCR